MPNKILPLTEQLNDYVVSISRREVDVLRRLREEVARHPQAQMQISPEQGQFMALLVQLMGAKRTLEVGVFTGYSSLCTALALPADGKIVACDISEEYTEIARRYWMEAGVADKITLRLGPARATLDELLTAGQAETFDFAFIDADKENYANYYEQALRLVRVGGLIMIDNVLWKGRVADPANQERDTVAIRILNEKLHRDERISLSLVSFADGITLALKLA